MKNVRLNKKNIGIFILSYKRLKHLKKVIKNVKQNISSLDKIYIFADNINLKKKYKEQNQVIAVLNYLKQIKDKQIVIIYQKKNIGLKKNWEFAYEYMFKKFNKVISLQDDDVIKKEFIGYMVFYLNKFEKKPKIMSITGFATKVNLPKKYKFDSYLTKRSMSWSQASWKRVWIQYKKLKKDHLGIIKDSKNKKLLNEAGTDLLPLIILEYFKLIDSIQIWWSWNVIKNHGLCINPVKSLVDNIGFLDGTGTHYYQNKFLQNNTSIKNKKRLNKIFYDEKINYLFKQNYNSSKLTFFVFNFLPLLIIRPLYLVKNMIKK